MKISEVKEPGFFWAKSLGSYQWYNLIVEVYGDSPFLRVRAWNRSSGLLYEVDPKDLEHCEMIKIEEP